MTAQDYYTLHPLEGVLPDEFHYGNMRVTRKALDATSRHGKRLVAIFDSYRRAGVFPGDTRLIGDYLEHNLIKGVEHENEFAGRFIGLVFGDGSYQYVRLEGEGIGVEKHKLELPSAIHILTDTCLFCAANATMTLETGEVLSVVAPRTKISAPVRELRVSERMCPYEMDAVLRLADLISAMTLGSKVYRKAYLAMPTVEYHFYLMDAYSKGLITTSMMLEWIGHVNRHAEKIVGALRKRLTLEAEMCCPLCGVQPYVEECVQKGQPADFETVKEILSRENGLWRDVLHLARPVDWKSLNYTSYIISVLEAGLVRRDENRLAIDIENPSEQRILRSAARIARQLEAAGGNYRFRVIGIYPHEKVFIAEDSEQRASFQRLYYLEQRGKPRARCYRQIVVANRQKLETSSRSQ